MQEPESACATQTSAVGWLPASESDGCSHDVCRGRARPARELLHHVDDTHAREHEPRHDPGHEDDRGDALRCGAPFSELTRDTDPHRQRSEADYRWYAGSPCR